MANASGRHVGIAVVELGGSAAQSWSLNGDDQFTAASTYKLPLLEANAQAIAAGKASPNDQLCYQSSDWEAGWFGDYADGACYSRQELAYRIGHYSDNTAAHILMRELGGGDVLNDYARNAGATGSAFWDPNTTTTNDLAHLWVAEATGRLGGKVAQDWLYQLLSHTYGDSGIGAGVPDPPGLVVRKGGWINATENDSSVIYGAAAGPYVLVICTDGNGDASGWQMLADMSAKVWAYEVTRTP
jgi:beta-lactamase class A